tara:strand:+ start:18869 stop:19876 length:1008 start_codon:yes stop_codon:yes gene_type:complete
MVAFRAILGRFWENLTGKDAKAPTGADKAKRAQELNTAISRLWQADGTHDKDAFEQQIVPIYTALLDQLRTQLPAEEAEARVLALLQATTAACHYRWSVRLPMKRPGSDYRKYEIIYTYALLTAMAVQCLRDAIPDNTISPQDLAASILPEAGRAQLQADALVWEDWLGFFEQATLGGLYTVSRFGAPEAVAKAGATTPVIPTATPVNPTQPPPGSGKAMLLAIKTALDTGTLSYNQPGDLVQVDREGRTYLVHPAILEWCKRELSLDDDTKRLENRFSRLKILKRTRGGNLLYRGRLRGRDAHSQGYLVEDPTCLWHKAAPQGRFVIENVTAKS